MNLGFKPPASPELDIAKRIDQQSKQILTKIKRKTQIKHKDYLPLNDDYGDGKKKIVVP